MTCLQCKLIKYSSSSSPFANISGPFVYALFSDCIARKAYTLDPSIYVFKLGFSAGNQDRFRSIVDGWRYKGKSTPPLGNCRNWNKIGTWKMRTAEAFERKFIKLAKERMRILPPHVYLGEQAENLSPHSNGETEIYWFNNQDFADMALYQDRVCTEEPGSVTALLQIFRAIKDRNDAFKSKLAGAGASSFPFAGSKSSR
ncbi:hypothetical protein ACFFP0_04050 [Rhizobium puerariae]|uniref:GIY-YIG nuclease family protein n=1 Tax=Rhizobium puerariae TaxID=1585791 RepID=A0ABV6ABR1_9HYPH